MAEVMQVQVGINAGSEERVKREYPDGTNLDQYHKCKGWPYRRWAWEFLCRNSQFIKDSDAAVNGTQQEKSRVAKKYGLVKFKYYGDVQTRRNVFPTFIDGALRILENFGDDDIHEDICIRPGQVVIRFKLVTAINSELALKRQLERAEKVLEKKRIQYLKKINKSIKPEGIRVSSFVESLRILDLIAAGKQDEILEYIYPDRNPQNQREKLDSNIRSVNRKIKTAKAYSKHLYRYVALQSGNPFL